jgi:threonine dehydrogenase-like Zn-dependent dehydrogenase
VTHALAAAVPVIRRMSVAGAGVIAWLAVAIVGCADPALQLAAKQSVERAAKAETEAEALDPPRIDQLTYRMPLKQAREALASGHDQEAQLMADKAYQAAVDVRDRRLQAKQLVTVRMAELETMAQAVAQEPDPMLDKEDLFRDLEKRWTLAKKRLAALDYEGSLVAADEAIGLLKRRGQLYRKAIPIRGPAASDESVATPAPEAPSAAAPPSLNPAADRGTDEPSFFDRLRKAATHSGGPTGQTP